jgi:hypothetical protein
MISFRSISIVSELALSCPSLAKAIGSETKTRKERMMCFMAILLYLICVKKIDLNFLNKSLGVMSKIADDIVEITDSDLGFLKRKKPAYPKPAFF